MSGKSEVFLPLSRRSRKAQMTRPLSLGLWAITATVVIISCNYYFDSLSREPYTHSGRIQQLPINAEQILQKCASLRNIPGPEAHFHDREVSDRFEPGTKSTLIKNATIWTGLANGTEIIKGDILLKKGVVRGLGDVPQELFEDDEKNNDLVVIEASGAWVTPGLVDLHTHLGVASAPLLEGAMDVNSPHGPIVPWLRSIDGFNTHDDSFELAIAGGVTTAQVLPGSANAIGGQSFMVKLRRTAERSPSSMILEPPHSLNGTDTGPDGPLRWRHLKQACGENLKQYGTRMDSIWAFRSAYNEARKIKEAQDLYCLKAEAGLWNDIQGSEYPDSFKWEALVDVLRGRVRISNHCYEAVDLDDLVRLSNEFKFHIASFHHASEAYLVPGVLNRTFGGPPAVALFAKTHRYTRETYRGSEFAPRILTDHNISVIMKSDHPLVNSRYLLHEAQQAHYYGLQPHLALTAVTSTPAYAAGVAHRVGVLHEGVDADVVIWDSHPLNLGAIPRQVWIDGIPQLNATSKGLVGETREGKEVQETPLVPTWDEESAATVQYEGLPPLGPNKVISGKVVLKNVKEVWERGDSGVKERWSARPSQGFGTVVLADGEISCVGRDGWCFAAAENADTTIDIHGGMVGPGLMTVGSRLGTEEMGFETSTGPGISFNPYIKNVPKVLEDAGGLVRAADSLKFQTRDALVAHRAGVTYGTSTLGDSVYTLETTFRTGAVHALESGAIVKDITALHVHIVRPFGITGVSVGSQIAALRRLLLSAEDHNTETGHWFHKAAEGAIPLIISVESADIMATLLHLKADIEDQRGSRMHMVFNGATEAHLLAKELAKAKVGVIMLPRQFPLVWDRRRIVAGPPLTNNTAITTLLEHGVVVGISITEPSEAGGIRFDAAWAALESNGRLDKGKTYDLITTNLEKLYGITGWLKLDGALAIYDGGDIFSLSSKVVGVALPKKKTVELF
ncbi:hypothetical protein ABKN59_001342 [Abortiporus biennis]